MLTISEFQTLVDSRGSLVIDGGLATEFEARGHDLNHALWSAKLLRDNPDVIKDVHRDYFLAGANVAITASYQASIEGFYDHCKLSETDSVELIKRSVQLARSASEAALDRSSDDRIALVAGSVGSYGAFLSDGSEYRGDYNRTKKELQAFHSPRIEALIDAGVDLLALETMPQLVEIETLLGMLRDEFPGAVAWVSCTLAEPGHISDGTCIEQVLRVVNQYQDVVLAFGINCVPTALVMNALQLMKRRTKLPLLCYPNSGEAWDAETKTWLTGEGNSSSWAEMAKAWGESGAKLIGGCCRTGPKNIADIASALRTSPRNAQS